ncbi:hypothetical protein V9T40_007600 [Parthenolecanium corni]|uniref:RING-type domain-containing protein n=1 Tax=Parthenolecanium corni TaxID=536013 RepID=A0AAN9TK66_9HEMI
MAGLKVIEILITYIDFILNGGTANVPISNSMSTIINVTLILDQKNLLFERLWDGLEYNEDSVYRDIFLHELGAVIIEEKVQEIPPAIMQQLVIHLVDEHLWKELELCILNVNIECLDIQQALPLCRQYSMHSALISIWNRGMLDFVSPLQELLPRLKIALDTNQVDYARDLGNKLLVYISCCFAGHAYPQGELVESMVDNVRNQVFQTICVQHSINADEDEGIHPYLRILLRFDTKEFLNVLAMAFNAKRFTPQVKQRFADILLLVIFPNCSLAAHEIGWVFTFLCKQASSESSRRIKIDPAVYEKVINLLVSERNSIGHEERQQALLDLIIADNFQNIKPEQLLSLAKKAGFFHVCREIYEKLEDYNQVLQCYLLDPHRKHDVFAYLERFPEKEVLEPFVMEHFDALLQVDSEKSGSFFGRFYPDSVKTLIDKMPRQRLYYFLKGASPNVEFGSSLVTLFMQLQCEYSSESEVLNYVRAHKNLQLEPALKVSTEYNLHRVSALLLERQGNFQEAYDILFSRLRDNMQKEENVEDATEELISLIHRGSYVLEPKATWLPLLQCLSTLNSRELLRRVLGSADLNLATELHLLLQHNAGTLGDYRDLVTGLFDKCTYEYATLKSVSKSVYSDLHDQLAKTLNSSKRGISGPEICSLCRHSFKTKLLLFGCGHGYHSECAESVDVKCNLCTSSQ